MLRTRQPPQKRKSENNLSYYVYICNLETSIKTYLPVETSEFSLILSRTMISS
ncbi:hypothetical protein B7P43_G18209 [Cryptotermes secundus]|uniref:Uncharacterized protein n=1 Tax=Cryptotermes secundus TaxID=105785 RepID=A0A2J7PPF7_9NEOP|nr:hypothetical protein B7P43_G18209 [Cryptotermes secundus]